jgi:hypothetical protein
MVALESRARWNTPQPEGTRTPSATERAPKCGLPVYATGAVPNPHAGVPICRATEGWLGRRQIPAQKLVPRAKVTWEPIAHGNRPQVVHLRFCGWSTATVLLLRLRVLNSRRYS